MKDIYTRNLGISDFVGDYADGVLEIFRTSVRLLTQNIYALSKHELSYFTDYASLEDIYFLFSDDGKLYFEMLDFDWNTIRKTIWSWFSEHNKEMICNGFTGWWDRIESNKLITTNIKYTNTDMVLDIDSDVYCYTLDFSGLDGVIKINDECVYIPKDIREYITISGNQL